MDNAKYKRIQQFEILIAQVYTSHVRHTLAVFAVNAGGTADAVVDGKDALLTADDSHQLAQTIIRALQDDDLRQSLRTAARAKARTYGMKRQAQRLIDVYEQAIADKKANRFVQVDRQNLC